MSSFGYTVTKFIDVPMVKGETIQRRFKEGYREYAKKNRKGPVDFSVIPVLQRLIAEFATNDRMLVNAHNHLNDAANKALTKKVRQEHFDIAGSLVWEYSFPDSNSTTYAFMQIWSEANGI